MTTAEERLSRSSLLMGSERMARLRDLRILVFGVGGVGSWCVEALVRTGIGHITIVDSDCVSMSNINRQLMATTKTVGLPKVEVMSERLREINPDCEVTAEQKVYNQTTADDWDFNSYDYVIDCIDSLKDKMLLIERATRSSCRFYSSMGAALKLDPTRVRVAEFYKVAGCPLARALRQRFKREGRRPGKKFLCVYSDELLPVLGECHDNDPRHPRINGSLMHITSIFGNTLAGLVIQDIYRSVGDNR